MKFSGDIDGWIQGIGKLFSDISDMAPGLSWFVSNHYLLASPRTALFLIMTKLNGSSEFQFMDDV